jgi:hypothetical protein
MKSLHHQRGYLTIVALMLIIIVGFLGSAIAYIYYGGALATANYGLSVSAFYLAEGGLQNGIRLLLTPNMTTTNQRVTCSALTGTSSVTNSSFGSGTYTVTTVSGSPYNVSTTLSGLINSDIVTATSTTGFAPSGRILIDNEAIDYIGISGNTFIGISRAANNSMNTTNATHAVGAYISQYQCSIQAKGGVPNLVSPYTSRTLQASVQLQDAWMVGPVSGNNFVLAEWNRPNELQWTSKSFTDATNRSSLASISLLSNATGWAVGTTLGTNFTIIRLQGNTWTATPLSGACSGSQSLNSVSAVSSQEAWAVGVNDQVSCTSGLWRYTILKWNGTTWTKLTPSTTPSIPADGSTSTTNPQLNEVQVIDASGNGIGDIGFAVGNNGRILKYNGTQWTQDTSPVATTLNSVAVVSASEAWAVGANGVILRWNGSTWSSYTSPTGTALNSIAMLDTNNDGLADAGWAVGSSGVAVKYANSTWTVQSPGGTALSNVAMFAANDAWATGTSGRVTHWDGSTWTNFTSNIAGTLTGIAVVRQGTIPNSTWLEIFP